MKRRPINAQQFLNTLDADATPGQLRLVRAFCALYNAFMPTTQAEIAKVIGRKHPHLSGQEGDLIWVVRMWSCGYLDDLRG